jgi:putative methionine-R-sulfoxide reductase with GAF domain
MSDPFYDSILIAKNRGNGEMKMNEINSIYPQDKMEMYALLQAQTRSLLEGETNFIANLANI